MPTEAVEDEGAHLCLECGGDSTHLPHKAVGRASGHHVSLCQYCQLVWMGPISECSAAADIHSGFETVFLFTRTLDSIIANLNLRYVAWVTSRHWNIDVLNAS